MHKVHDTVAHIAGHLSLLPFSLNTRQRPCDQQKEERRALVQTLFPGEQMLCAGIHWKRAATIAVPLQGSSEGQRWRKILLVGRVVISKPDCPLSRGYNYLGARKH